LAFLAVKGRLSGILVFFVKGGIFSLHFPAGFGIVHLIFRGKENSSEAG